VEPLIRRCLPLSETQDNAILETRKAIVSHTNGIDMSACVEFDFGLLRQGVVTKNRQSKELSRGGIAPASHAGNLSVSSISETIESFPQLIWLSNWFRMIWQSAGDTATIILSRGSKHNRLSKLPRRDVLNCRRFLGSVGRRMYLVGVMNTVMKQILLDTSGYSHKLLLLTDESNLQLPYPKIIPSN
jgi:hypothetical protein